MLKFLLPSLRATLLLAGLTGIAYPLFVTAVAQSLFPAQAAGSLIFRDGQPVGSSLLGQPFGQDAYFHPRPSSAGSGYAGEASSGSNLGPTSRKLILGVRDDPATKDRDETYAGVSDLVARFRSVNGLPPGTPVPVDAVTRSASGLDPHISPMNASLQATRVARARSCTPEQVLALVRQRTEPRALGALGEPRINVLLLNLELDRRFGKPSVPAKSTEQERR